MSVIDENGRASVVVNDWPPYHKFRYVDFIKNDHEWLKFMFC